MGKRFHATTAAWGSERGEKHRAAKLTNAQAIQIKRMYRAGERGKKHGKAFGITSHTFNAIGRGDRWCHLNDEAWNQEG